MMPLRFPFLHRLQSDVIFTLMKNLHISPPLLVNCTRYANTCTRPLYFHLQQTERLPRNMLCTQQSIAKKRPWTATQADFLSLSLWHTHTQNRHSFSLWGPTVRNPIINGCPNLTEPLQQKSISLAGQRSPGWLNSSQPLTGPKPSSAEKKKLACNRNMPSQHFHFQLVKTRALGQATATGQRAPLPKRRRCKANRSSEDWNRKRHCVWNGGERNSSDGCTVLSAFLHMLSEWGACRAMNSTVHCCLNG